MKWISVKDKKPRTNEAVLLCTEYGMQATAYLSSHDGCWVDWMRPQHTYGSVTHWMPLPKPPKEER